MAADFDGNGVDESAGEFTGEELVEEFVPPEQDDTAAAVESGEAAPLAEADAAASEDAGQVAAPEDTETTVPAEAPETPPTPEQILDNLQLENARIRHDLGRVTSMFQAFTDLVNQSAQTAPAQPSPAQAAPPMTNEEFQVFKDRLLDPDLTSDEFLKGMSKFVAAAQPPINPEALVQQARDQAVEAFRQEMVAAQMVEQHHAQNREHVKNFYAEHPALLSDQRRVGEIGQEIMLAHPEYKDPQNYQEYLAAVAAESYKRLGIRRVVEPQDEPPPGVKTSGARVPVTKLKGLQKELQDFDQQMADSLGY